MLHPSNATGFIYLQAIHPDLVWYNVKQLYYTNYLSSSKGDLAPTQSIIPGVTREDDVIYRSPFNTPRL